MLRLALSIWLAGCMGAWAQQQLANPAAQNCVATGGEPYTERSPRGEYGVCVFANNRQCEEWALFNGQCPAGGLLVTGYDTAAERFCAITGGLYQDGFCTLPNGKPCKADSYYLGTCP
jgi:putative hemolysin